MVGTYLGLKTKIAHFTADLHQREQERTITNEKLNRTKRIPHKPFYAIDVVLDDLDLRATSALFSEVRCGSLARIIIPSHWTKTLTIALRYFFAAREDSHQPRPFNRPSGI